MSQYTVQELLGVDDHGQPQKREVVVPDGKWVVQVSTSLFREEEWDDSGDSGHEWNTSTERTYRVVGSEPQEKYALDRYRNSREYDNGRSIHRSAVHLLVGDESFGVILEENEDRQRSGGFWFSCARQIHKGELGRRPQIPRPQFARETNARLEEVGWNGERRASRDLRRGKHGWARLEEVAKLVRMTPEEVARHYWLFTHAETPRLDVLFAEQREQIHCQAIKPEQRHVFHWDGLPQLFDRDPKTIWVRQGFALTVLYLHHFGYIPPLPGEMKVV